MIHEIDIKRQWDGLDQTMPGRVASKVIGFPEDVYRLITDDERRKDREFKRAARCAVGAGLLIFWAIVVKLVLR